jgi:hypothetical protein
VLGIAVLVAVLDGASPADPVGAFTSAYVVVTGAALVAGALALTLGRVRASLVTPVPEAA